MNWFAVWGMFRCSNPGDTSTYFDQTINTPAEVWSLKSCGIDGQHFACEVCPVASHPIESQGIWWEERKNEARISIIATVPCPDSGGEGKGRMCVCVFPKCVCVCKTGIGAQLENQNHLRFLCNVMSICSSFWRWLHHKVSIHNFALHSLTNNIYIYIQ